MKTIHPENSVSSAWRPALSLGEASLCPWRRHYHRSLHCSCCCWTLTAAGQTSFLQQGSWGETSQLRHLRRHQARGHRWRLPGDRSCDGSCSCWSWSYHAVWRRRGRSPLRPRAPRGRRRQRRRRTPQLLLVTTARQRYPRRNGGCRRMIMEHRRLRRKVLSHSPAPGSNSGTGSK